ncbi:uncharacterized protein C9orf43 homolog isoform X1 [Podarcis raffonei]|uniref:uncharacterized protein C9orf43 homolog isoform X1 n=1 Tax=Podarcis raffonei TaxID=65483 RepID=UPI0023292568|nr:uncharacterized protein C9orf43 homolog isoform X1 [Podarcis raffonei]XP_053236706.1 uncharacterized protein C9orf43 homolog isoform X1 [Podarcis raffonei]XP_053236796.1 uncharacterized protein C9orf43 homolog isoform X1 [Podarcis raffonei]
MATIDASQWDETICDMIACQHPPCWEAVQRIVKGQPRIMLRSLDSPEGDSPEPDDELPTLKIVDLPLNYSQRNQIRCAESLLSISKTISSIKGSRSYSNTTLNNALMPPISRISSERYPFPGLNSRMETRASHFTPISFTCLRQAEKIQVTDFSESAVHGLCTHLPPCGSLVVTWVPDRRHRLLRPEKPATRGVRVKDLASESTLMVVEKKEMKRKKSNKVPTGGQPYLLHLRKKPKEPANMPSILAGKEKDPKGSLLVSKERDPKGSLLVSKERDPKGSLLGEKSFSSCHSQLAPVAPPLPRCRSLLHLENRRGEVAARKEELESLFTVQKAPSAKIPMKENLLRRTPSQLKFALRDSVAFRRPMPMLVEQQEVADPPCSGGGGGGLPDKAQLHQEGLSAVRAGQISQPAENSRTQVLPPPPPATAATAADGQKPSVKFESHKSSTGALYMEADGEFWLKRVAQKQEKTHFQFQSINPPPPPPSPLMSETSD